MGVILYDPVLCEKTVIGINFVNYVNFVNMSDAPKTLIAVFQVKITRW